MSKKYSLFNKFISFSLIFTLLFSVAAIGTYAETTTRDFNKEIEDIQAKIDANNNKKADSEKTIDELREEIQAIQEQLNVYQLKIDDLNAQIAEKDAVIAQYESEIAALDVEINEANIKIDTLGVKIDETYDTLKERLRASYMAGETSTLEILLGSSDYESFLTRLELLSVVARHDNELVSGLQKDINDLDKLKEELDSKKAEQVEKQTAVESDKAVIVEARNDVQATYNSIDAKQTSIEKKVQQVNSVIAGLDASSANYRAEMAKIEKDKAEYDAQISSGMSSGSGSISGGGGTSAIGNYPVSAKGMICPLQYSNVYISQHYGHNGHKGVDMCTRGTGSTMGKEIRAAADGTVSTAEYHYSWGNNVYINHGNGVYTRYAHCSRMIVSPGQSVKQGQVIAYAGNTGNSYGAHLHFEVWINGTRVNPEPWIPALPD